MNGLNDYPMPPLRPEVDRDGYGRYMLPNPEDPGRVKAYTRTTTLSKAISDTYNLGEWSKRMIVQGLAADPKLLATVDLTQDDRTLRDDLTRVHEAAMEASGAHVARERGTQLHYFTEAVDGGHLTIDQVPGEYRNEVAAYQAAMAKAGIIVPPESIERILLNLTANVVGTADRQTVIMPNGMRLMADVKTGKDLSYSWAEIAMQLGIYANADAMLEYDEQGNPSWGGVPEVEKNVALVMHVPVDQGKCTLWLVDIAAGWAAVELASEVREYRSRRNLATHLDPKAWGAPAESLEVYGAGGARLGGAELDAAMAPSEAQLDGAALAELAAVAVDQGIPLDKGVVAGALKAEGYAITEAGKAHVESGKSLRDTASPLDLAKVEFEVTRDEAAKARAARSRRNSAQVRADEAAGLVDDGEPTVDLYVKLTKALRDAYKLDVTPKTAPPAKGPVEAPTGTEVADAIAEGKAAAKAMFGEVPSDFDDTGAGTPLTVVPDPPVEVKTKYGTPVSKGDPRVIECTETIDRADPTPEAMAQVYADYADVWDAQFHTERASARIEAETARIAAAQAPASDPHLDRMNAIAAALRACKTTDDMAAVYNAHADVWTDEMTAYGQSILAATG